jgi:hypothetical protein
VRITQDSELEWEFEAETSSQPVFRFICTGGCHFGNEAQCRRILRTAIRDAIGLASGAAAALEGPPSAETVRLFRSTFGHPPSRAVPWAGGLSSGTTLARRYRLAVNALLRGGTAYVCDATLAANARTVNPNRVLLVPSFWTQRRRMDRAATMLHEMMHQYFLEFILHNEREHRRNNAHCLANFALGIRGITPPKEYLEACSKRPV